MDKLTLPSTENAVQSKINEIIDNKVSNTDYATSSVAGVIKPSSAIATGVSSAGVLYGTTKTYADYTSASNYMIVGKGTLENVLTGKGYTSNVGTVTSVNNVQPDVSGNVDIDSGLFRNIGEIITSTIPLTDAGLHLLDGALISGSGSYSAFVDYIAGLYDSGNYTDIFDTEANWQQSVTDYGVCGKFVYDSVDNTVRLPKITGFVEGASGTSTLGDLTEAGLPNITGEWNSGGDSGVFVTSSGAFTSGSAVTKYFNTTQAGSPTNIKFDASRSSSIYGNSTTVQPQAIKVLYYVVITTITKTEIEVDIDEIATDLNGKADVDLSNVPNSKGILTESYVNGSSWYRVYSDGWCEQGGQGELIETSTTTITLLKAYSNTNYTVLAVSITASTAADAEAGLQCTPISNNQITLTAHYINPNNQVANWYTCGYTR